MCVGGGLGLILNNELIDLGLFLISVHKNMLWAMEGYQGHNSNTPYALFHLRYMAVNHALSQSDMLHTFFENSILDISIWVLCSPY